MKSLKWIFGLGILFGITGACLDDEPVNEVTYQYKEIDSVRIGEIKPAPQVTEITTYFVQDSDCEYFFDYDYFISGNERSVSLITAKVEGPNCINTPQTVSNVLLFKPDEPGTYTFRFWTGESVNDEADFIIKEIEIP